MRYALTLWALCVPLAAHGAEGWKEAPQTQKTDGAGGVVLAAGTRIPLVLLRAVSTRNAAPGDQVYLQTLAPVAANRRIVIPAGSHVTGTITQVERPGRVKGRGQLFVRFDTVLFDNGVQLDLNGKLGALDGDHPGTVNRDEGKVVGPGGKGQDAMTAVASTMGGTMLGGWIGGTGRGAGIGAGAGAAAGLATILLTRGPEAALPAGSSVEMVLQRDLRLAEADLPPSRVGQAPALMARPAADAMRPGFGRWWWPLWWGPYF